MKRIQYLIIGWLTLTGLAILGGCAYEFHNIPEKAGIDLQDFVIVALSTGAVATSCNLMYRGYTEKALADLLQTDIIALFIGAFATIWISFETIVSVFKN
ncbi:MAG: hypothetical protein AB4057_08575 [Crocosphaera sp.]